MNEHERSRQYFAERVPKRARIALHLGDVDAELLLALPGRGLKQTSVDTLLARITDAINEHVNLGDID